MKPEQVFWLGGNPDNCDTCKGAITDEFVDAVHVSGSWAIMCPQCHSNPRISRGKLGTGFGQRYTRQPDGQFLKVEG
jgi:hypothetical protein